MENLIGLGYWRSLWEPLLPDPASFVDASWPTAQREIALQYLDQGRVLRSYMGYSWCRFRCGVSVVEMGASDLTDGSYCWPEGLAHYVRHHQIRLPESVMQHIEAQPHFPIKQANQVSEITMYDVNWWRSQTGWQNSVNSFLSETDQQVKDFLRRHERGQIFQEHCTLEEIEATKQLVERLKIGLT